jgi:5-methylcytosine-specific restriction endonuclease McrA
LDPCGRVLTKAGTDAVPGPTRDLGLEDPGLGFSNKSQNINYATMKSQGAESTLALRGDAFSDAKAAHMDQRHKNGLRPRPKIRLGGVVPDSTVPKGQSAAPGSRPSVMQAPVLVLNATFEPINVTAVRRALVLLLKGVAQTEETNHTEVHSTQKAIQVPSVIRLLSYRHIPQQSRALSRKNILLRDRNTCQFCTRAFPASELTLDHVMPRSRGGRSSWENLVACCYACNNRKGDRTPEEAGFKLQRRPRPFTLHTSRQLMRLIGNRDEKWRKYLFY